MKQSTLQFKPIKKGAKKKDKDSDDSDDIDFGSISPLPQRTQSRRTAGIVSLSIQKISTYLIISGNIVLFAKSVWITVKKNYNMSSEDSDDNSPEMFGPSSDSEQMYV